jgi:glycosyltransferase involved in cell wall biosynthesis
MKVLIVCSGTSGQISPFIVEQAESLKKNRVKIDYFLIIEKGFFGYIKSRKELLKKGNDFKPNIIHAHYGLSGLLANLQRKTPVVTTFHGGDIYIKQSNILLLFLSLLATFLSKTNIFVNNNIPLFFRLNYYRVIPCGVFQSIFSPISKSKARKQMQFEKTTRYILFSSSFDNVIKNYPLAKRALGLLNDENIKLIELKGCTRQEVSILMNTADLALMTSVSEGSPQFIKEAMACNIPIVSTDVGDVKEVIGNTEGCYITTFEPEDVADKIKKALEFAETKGRTKGRERLKELGLDSKTVAKKIINVYEKVLKS